MVKLSRLTATLGACVASTVLAGSVAWGAIPDPKAPVNETSQEIYEHSTEPVVAPNLAQIVVTDSTGVQVLEAPENMPLRQALKQNGLKPADYRGEDGSTVTLEPLTVAEPVFLFKMEYRGSASRIEIPAPVTEVRVNGIPEGTRIVQQEGSPGLGMLTTVVETDLSADRAKNDEADARRKVSKRETLTVITAPVAQVVLMGALDDLSPRTNTAPVEGECTNGTSVPETVDVNIIAIHRAVCIKYPEVLNYGTYRDSCPVTCDHHDGIAVDIMVSGDPGWLIAEYLASASSLYNINYLIYQQQIWEPSRPYWRKMEDRGSPTANHMDHVHVSVYRYEEAQ